jgi:hypothetical protein
MEAVIKGFQMRGMMDRNIEFWAAEMDDKYMDEEEGGKM